MIMFTPSSSAKRAEEVWQDVELTAFLEGPVEVSLLPASPRATRQTMLTCSSWACPWACRVASLGPSAAELLRPWPRPGRPEADRELCAAAENFFHLYALLSVPRPGFFPWQAFLLIY